MGRPVTITADVADVLSRSTVVGGNTVVLPEGQLDRGLYMAVDKVLKALGGKWSRGKGHVFALGLGDQLEPALANGKAIDLKKANEQFFTPPDIVDRMVTKVGVRVGDTALEPSAGEGRIVRVLLDRGAEVQAVEIDDRYMPALCGFQRTYPTLAIHRCDFLYWPATTRFDVIVMNPPFSRGQDVQHFLQAWAMLAPGGRIACIMGEHAFGAQDQRSVDFRNTLAIVGAEVEILPPGTFKAEGTMVGARIVYARNAV